MSRGCCKLLTKSLCMVLFVAGFTEVLAQKALPNPLIQPPKRGTPGAAPAGAPEGASAEGAAPAGQTAAKEPGGEQDSALKDILGKLSGLYVSAIIGDMAVLRAAASGGSGAGAPSGGSGGGSGASGGAAGGGGGRTPVYFVRDAEPFHIFDRYRLLPRIQDTTVLLYLLSDNPQDLGRRAQIVFRSSLDSNSTPSYIPPKLESAGSGDGGAYQSLINVGSGGGGGGGAKPSGGAAK